MTTEDRTIEALIEHTAECKVQADQWTADYNDGRDEVLAAMTDAQMKTTTVSTDVGDVLATVVPANVSTYIDPVKLRAKLKKQGVSTRRINTIVPPDPRTYTVDEDELAAAIDDGLITARGVPQSTGNARKAYVKITIK